MFTKAVRNKDVDAHLECDSENFNLICLANHFQRTSKTKKSLITVEIVFIIEQSKRRRKTEEKFAIHEIQQLFFVVFFFSAKKFHFHYW